jgi:hypothetical protein
MEKYRVKQEVYKDGSVKYYPQYYKGFLSGWLSLQRDGEKCQALRNRYDSSREDALNAVDLCDKGKNIVINITYEYIN